MSTFIIKGYAAKSSAKRNAIAQLVNAGNAFDASAIEISGEKGNYKWANATAFVLTPSDDGLLHVSAMVGACALVWDIAEQMLKADPSVKRKAILEACTKKGIAYYTARTQYQKYREAAANDAAIA